MLAQPKLEEMTVLGRSIPRLDSYEKVTGRAVYAYDLELPHMLHGKIKRSPHPHAEIIRIDTSRAERLPGVRAVITGRDASNALYGSIVADTPTLAYDRVRYVGEPVAAVAADSPEVAEEALELIEVEYRELPALFDPEEAIKEEQKVVLHPDLLKYRRTPWKPPRFDPKRPNVSAFFQIRKGDVERAFQEADLIVENRYSTQMVHHFYTEPNAVVAKFEPDGSLTVWTSTQSAYRTRHELSDALRMPPSKIRVIVPYVGGGFGNKITLHCEAICALLAKKAGRPVRIQMTREEAMIATTVRHPFVIYCKHGVKKDGKILALKMRIILDGGAYSGGAGIFVTRQCPLGAVSVYSIPNLWIDSYRAYTNKVPGGAFRGFGDAQVSFAIESQMDIIAKELGLDPFELRARNFLQEGEINPINERMKGVSNRRCLEKVAEALRRPSPRLPDGPWRYGKGMAIVAKYSLAKTVSSAWVRLNEDGTLDLWTSATEIGTGAHTILVQIAAEEFKKPVEEVRLLRPDTLTTPLDEGAFSSRQTYNAGNAVKLACQDLKRQICELASKKLGVDPEELEVDGDIIRVKGGKEGSMKLTELFARGKTRFGSFLEGKGGLVGMATFYQQAGDLDPETGQCNTDRFVAFYEYAAGGVELAVNVETGHVRILRYIAATDVGRAINPKLVEGQIEGAVAMGLGATITEELLLREGRPINADLMNYKPPYGLDAPYIEPIILETPYPDGPFGAKGCGEASIAAVAPAIANALSDALGIRIKELPITPERVFAALKSR